MRLLKIFFDYSCPFCRKAYEYLVELVAEDGDLFSDIGIEWHPCEAHPRPDSYGPHSDLCIRGMYFAEDAGADIWQYNARMFDAVFVSHIDIEDAAALAEFVSDIVDAEAFKEALTSGRYEDRLQAGNDYAYKVSGVWAVPSYRLDGEELNAIENVGVTKEELRSLISA
ncbi:MAG: DsbA family protein [Clostridiales Family XIII bacterium]|jgi:predicted DsbA family dithiol-disulfide isomerase|nr:DsbA family protein [Clostridiales Family XIII bacterium]